MVSCEDKTNVQIDGLERSKVIISLGKVIHFLRVRNATGETSRCSDQERRACAVCTFDPTSKLCFLQWYEVLDNSALRVDDIESALTCIRLRWHRSDKVPGILDSG